jgi:hypothetical protein
MAYQMAKTLLFVASAKRFRALRVWAEKPQKYFSQGLIHSNLI